MKLNVNMASNGSAAPSFAEEEFRELKSRCKVGMKLFTYVTPQNQLHLSKQIRVNEFLIEHYRVKF